MMEERWEMIRWVTGYLSRNQERWEVEKRERDQERRRRLDEWDKEERFRKISMLREKMGRRGEREKGKDDESIRDGWTKWRQEEEEAEILEIGVECTDPTGLGPMLDMGVRMSTKKRGRNVSKSEIQNPKSKNT